MNDWPDEWADDDEETVTVKCPSCGADVYEDAVQCPVCNEYVPSGKRLLAGRPLWFLIVGLAGVAALFWFLVVR